MYVVWTLQLVVIGALGLYGVVVLRRVTAMYKQEPETAAVLLTMVGTFVAVNQIIYASVSD